MLKDMSRICVGFGFGICQDFLVEFDHAHPEAMKFQTYLGLKESLEKLLGRSVDLVEESAVVNPYLKAEFERSRVGLFEA